MKRAIIRRIFVAVIAILTPAIGQGVMLAYAKLPPEMAALVDPWTATTLAVGIASGALAWGLARWQGIPVAEIQSWLTERGLYDGRIDGDAGPKTKVALAKAIDTRGVRSQGLVKRPAFKRPQGGKIP